MTGSVSVFRKYRIIFCDTLHNANVLNLSLCALLEDRDGWKQWPFYLAGSGGMSDPMRSVRIDRPAVGALRVRGVMLGVQPLWSVISCLYTPVASSRGPPTANLITWLSHHQTSLSFITYRILFCWSHQWIHIYLFLSLLQLPLCAEPRPWLHTMTGPYR
jgi:hypothetical protein